MSFVTELNKKCQEYTDMVIGGTRIQLPYENGKKNLPSEIRSKLLNTGKSGAELQKWATDNPDNTGVDCSGLVYYALNEAVDGAVRAYFEDALGQNGLTYGHGIKASHFTDTQHGKKIARAADMVPGCVMRSNNGEHVLVITGVSATRIDYTHSSSGHGPHAAYISIGNPNADLKDSAQTWHDEAYTDSRAKSLYNYTVLLDCISQKSGKWVQENGNWFYYESGVKLTGWQEVGGYWYYLGTDGAMQTGWKEIDGIWYYMHSDGRMASSEWIQSKTSGLWYYVHSDGRMASGEWIESKGEWYYLHHDGSMAVNYWIETDEGWYYVQEDGTMVRSASKEINGKVYNFDANGLCLNP